MPPIPSFSSFDLSALFDRAARESENAWPGGPVRGHRLNAIAADAGGRGLDPLALHLLYERQAVTSLPLALIFSQYDSAISIIEESQNAAARKKLLNEVATGAFVTVGIAQLTTSRQGGAPSMIASETDTGFLLNGIAPWCSGAAHARWIVTGAASDAGQMLLALPRDAQGVNVPAPMHMVSMNATSTSEVRCGAVMLGREALLAGPGVGILAKRRKTLPLGQCYLAMGHTRGTIGLIESHDSPRARSVASRLLEDLTKVRDEVIAAATSPPDAAASSRIRGQCNDLAVRAGSAAVALFKGTALLQSHPAQMLSREALFLLVWSCPDPVIDCTVDLLSNSRN